MKFYTSTTRELMRLNDNLELIMGHFGINAVAAEPKKGDDEDEVTYSSDLESFKEEFSAAWDEMHESEESKEDEVTST